MKISFSFVSLLILFTSLSCNNDLNTRLITGQWKLIETLTDPGDGSGTYQPYEGNQIATFYSDSSVTFTESFCLSQGGIDGKIATFSQDSIQWEDCGLRYGYEIIDAFLFLYPPCIEPCGLKFEKISDG